MFAYGFCKRMHNSQWLVCFLQKIRIGHPWSRARFFMVQKRLQPDQRGIMSGFLHKDVYAVSAMIRCPAHSGRQAVEPERTL